MASIWTEERVAELRALIAKSKSLDQIAEIMGLTRGQISGKRNRLGYGIPGKRGGKRFIEIKPEPEPKVRRRPRRGLLTPPSMPIVDVTYTDHNRTLIQLSMDRCRWPLWGRMVPFEERLYCGAKCMGEHSYCEEHYVRSRRDPRSSLTTRRRSASPKSMVE
jgi:hypothetical protein